MQVVFLSDGIETIYIWVDQNSNRSHYNGDCNREFNHPAHIHRVSALGRFAVKRESRLAVQNSSQ